MVVRLQLLNVGRLSVLAVQICLVELENPNQLLFVALVHDVTISSAAVPRVAAVVTNARETLRGDLAVVLEADLVHVLVVTPGEMHIVETTVGRVDAVLGVVFRVHVVLVVLQELVVHDSVRVRETDGESVANNGPLRLGAPLGERKHLAEVVNQTSQVKPVVFGIHLAQALVNEIYISARSTEDKFHEKD